VPVRRWDEAAWLGGFVFSAVYVGVAFALWRRLPGLDLQPPASLGTFLTHAWNPSTYAGAPASYIARAAATLGASLAVGGWAFASALKPYTRIRHVSGPRLLAGKDAEQAALRQAAIERGKDKDGFLFLHPKLHLPKTRWTRHTLLLGSVGSGKTVLLMPVVQQLFESYTKTFLYDVKGDFTAKFPDAALVSPWDDRSRYWDVGADVRTLSQAAVFAAALIPATEGEGGNRYFSIAAQQLLLGTVRALQTEKGRSWGWRDLADRVNADRGAFARTLEEHYPKAAPLIADPNAQATSSVLATLAAFTRVIDDLAGSWRNGEGRKSVSLRSWLRDDFRGRKQIIVQGGPDAGLTSAYIGAMVRLLESMIISPAFADNEQGRSLVFVLDELPSLRVDISALIDKGRSKGCFVIAGLQDPIQLAEAIGPNKAQALMSMVGTHVVCRVQMGQSREQIAALFGRERVAYTALSSGASATGSTHNLSVHEETRAVVDPSLLSSELGVRKGKRKDWPHGFGIRAVVSLGGDALLLDFPGVVLPDRQPSHVPAAWTKPVRTKQKPEAKRAEGTEPAVVAVLAPASPFMPTAAGIAALAARFSKDHRDAMDPLKTT
jgi:hypothetical protein